MGGAKDDDGKRESCSFKVCVDPRTGRTILRPSDGCPEGFIEKVERSMRKVGVEVVYPPSVTSNRGDAKKKKKS